MHDSDLGMYSRGSRMSLSRHKVVRAAGETATRAERPSQQYTTISKIQLCFVLRLSASLVVHGIHGVESDV